MPLSCACHSSQAEQQPIVAGPPPGGAPLARAARSAAAAQRAGPDVGLSFDMIKPWRRHIGCCGWSQNASTHVNTSLRVLHRRTLSNALHILGIIVSLAIFLAVVLIPLSVVHVDVDMYALPRRRSQHSTICKELLILFVPREVDFNTG